MKKKIALVGSWPPPYGGVAVHIQRLFNDLSNRGLSVQFFDLHKKGWFLGCLFSCSIKIIHLHTSLNINTWILLRLFLLSYVKKVVLTQHSLRSSRELKPRDIFFLNKIQSIITVNEDIKKTLVDSGIKENKITVIHPFIQPSEPGGKDENIHPDLLRFCDGHHPILSAVASKISFYLEQDLYGIDLCIELSSFLKRIYPDHGFVFFLAHINDKKYFQQMKDKISELNLENNFVFFTQESPFHPFLEKVDIFVRPTNTDGLSISILEALTYGVPVVASDAVSRLGQVVVFQNRDAMDLFQKVNTVFQSLDHYKRKASLGEIENSVTCIMEIYKSLRKL